MPPTYARTFGSLMFAAVRSLERPVAAKLAPTSACRPLVDSSGLVLPSRNGPHSGWPKAPHPLGSLDSASRSDQPGCLPGHPSASAIGFGIAMTSGVRTRLGRSPSGTSAGLSWRRSASDSSPGQDDDD